jgi:hypothetical protein
VCMLTCWLPRLSSQTLDNETVDEAVTHMMQMYPCDMSTGECRPDQAGHERGFDCSGPCDGSGAHVMWAESHMPRETG